MRSRSGPPRGVSFLRGSATGGGIPTRPCGHEGTCRVGRREPHRRPGHPSHLPQGSRPGRRHRPRDPGDHPRGADVRRRRRRSRLHGGAAAPVRRPGRTRQRRADRQGDRPRLREPGVHQAQGRRGLTRHRLAAVAGSQPERRAGRPRGRCTRHVPDRRVRPGDDGRRIRRCARRRPAVPAHPGGQDPCRGSRAQPGGPRGGASSGGRRLRRPGRALPRRPCHRHPVRHAHRTARGWIPQGRARGQGPCDAHRAPPTGRRRSRSGLLRRAAEARRAEAPSVGAVVPARCPSALTRDRFLVRTVER